MKSLIKLLAVSMLLTAALILTGCTATGYHEYYDDYTEIILVPVPQPHPHPYPVPDYEPAPRPAPPRYEPLTRPETDREPVPRTKTRETRFAAQDTGTRTSREETPRKSPRFVNRSPRQKTGDR